MLMLMAACATSRAGSYGVVTFKPSADYQSRPIQYSVGKGHVAGSDLDLWLDGGCVRGAWGRVPIDFCRDDKGGGSQHWKGASGDITLTPLGDQLAVEGYWILDTGRGVPMTQQIPMEKGGGWDELRREPVLLALAASAAYLQAQHFRR